MRAPVYCDNSHTRKPMKELVLKGKEKKMNCLILRFLLFLWLTQKFKVGGFSTFVDITLEKIFLCLNILVLLISPLSDGSGLALMMHLILPVLPKISTESDFLWWNEHKGSSKRGKKDLIEALWLTSTHLQIISTIFWKNKLNNSK